NEPGSWQQPFELRLGGPPLTISGRAVASDGTPLPEPQVTLLDAECLVPGNDMSSIEFLARVSSRVTKDGAEFTDFGSFMPGEPRPGAFSLSGLQRRNYRLRLECQATCQWLDTEPIAAGVQDLELRLPAEPMWPGVAGIVVDRRGSPVARASVWMERVDPATNAVRSTPGLSTDADGRFVHGALACAARTLCVQTEGIAHPTRIDLAAQSDVAQMRLTAPVKTSARIAGALDADSGTFLDAQEQPIAVTITHGDSAWGAFDVPLVEGASEVVTVPDDAVTLVLRKQGREMARRRVELRPGDLQVLGP
ncbi:MAG: carboxypeptidase regulatory-like domain-containing protein, partial [Planctomycetes bacterium]|nr:carboxypeptidase regulatory-like domain-containing protein [Planctomycetota bacterium]